MRLTNKELMSAVNQPMCFGSRLVGKKMFAQIIKELCEYKTIEEELGIDLVALFKALKQGGVYVKADFLGDAAIKMHSFQICGDDSGITIWSQVRLNAKEYGKTWALTKEELL